MYYCVRSSDSSMNNRSVEIESITALYQYMIPEINVVQSAYIFTELISENIIHFNLCLHRLRDDISTNHII